MNKIKLTRYGHCCFLIEIADKKILIDPYDEFINANIGKIDADYLLISSVAHDHWNIAVSPYAYTYHEEWSTVLDNNIKITGIMTKEYRGTNNLIYNIKVWKYSITNFADLGDVKSLEMLSKSDKNILSSTNIAFVRPNMISSEWNISWWELALTVCDPKIIIPHHFFPNNFIEDKNILKERLAYLPLVEDMINKLMYKKKNIDGYSLEIDLDKCDDNMAILFSDIHPQVVWR